MNKRTVNLAVLLMAVLVTVTGLGFQTQDPTTLGNMTWTWDEANIRWESQHPVFDNAMWWVGSAMDGDTVVWDVTRLERDMNNNWVKDEDWHEDDTVDANRFINEGYAKAFVAGIVVIEAARIANQKGKADATLEAFGVWP